MALRFELFVKSDFQKENIAKITLYA